ncbi:MAG TPA: toll/interleukin-1 receptor domain-containing protein [Roseiarcus sp.]
MSESERAADNAPFDVFISHATSDKTIADAACAALEAAGIRCWIAPRDIMPGADWSAAIVEGLGLCRILVLVFSEHANQSDQVRNEVVQAAHNGLPIIPFRIEATAPTKSLAYFVSSLHWLDALTPPLEAHIGRLVETVRTLLAAQGHAPRPRPTEAPPVVSPASQSNRAGIKPSWRTALWPIAALAVGLAIVAVGAFAWFGGDRTSANVRAVQMFNPPTEQDLKRIRDIGAEHALILPELVFRAPTGNVDAAALRFIGVWSSDIGYNGTGSQAMLMVSTVGADRRAEGYVLNGPPTALSWDPKRSANTLPFHGEINGDVLTLKPENSKNTYVAKLNLGADTMTLSIMLPDGRSAAITLKAIWRLANGT